MTDADGPVLLFDGVCNLCSHGVAFIVRHERASGRRIGFAPLQSGFARRALTERGRDPYAMESMVIIDGERTLVKSDAALFVAGYLRRPWRWARWLGVLPRWFRDWVYGLIARSRYRVFGRRDACMVPTAELRARFLDTD